jgi:hypothetical protein
MFAFFAFLSLAVITEEVPAGYGTFQLNSSVRLKFTLSETEQAFVIGPPFLAFVNLTITEGNKSRMFIASDFQNAHGLSLRGETATLDFTGSPVAVATWVINRSECPEVAVAINPTKRYKFTLARTGELPAVCVFPLRSPPGDVSFGFRSGSGDAVLLPGPNDRCKDGICRKKTEGPFYAVFKNGRDVTLLGGGIFLRA